MRFSGVDVTCANINVTRANINVMVINIEPPRLNHMHIPTISIHWLQTAAAVATGALIVLVLTGTLHARVGAQGPETVQIPLPVIAQRYEVLNEYQRQQRFLGLIQAANRSQVGFEVPGAIQTLHVREGQTVASGDALASLDTQALLARQSAAASTVRRVEAELELAKARTQRQSPLKDSGAISAQTFDDTRLTEKALMSALDSFRAQLLSLDIDLEKSVLRAPYAARIGRQLLDRGAVTQPGVAVFTLVSTAEREAHIGIAVEQASFLEVGQLYSLEWRGETLDAALRAVRPDVNRISMTVVAIFDLPAAINAFDGEPVTVNLPRSEPERGGWLPLSALLEGERGVWTVLALRDKKGTTVALREVVEVLHVANDHAYVRGTLNPGDMVVTDGVHRIAPGTAVDAQIGTPTLITEI